MNEPGAGNVVIRGETSSTVQLNFDEESGNGETAHGDEDVGIVAFEDGIIPCFTPGTLIATPQGTRPVEALRPGDLVLTRDAGLRPVLWSSATTLPATRLARDPHLAPILIPTGALGPNLPDRDMMVSPQHRMLMTGWKAQLLTGSSEVLVPAKALTGMGGIRQLTDARSVRYLHLLFDSHQVICANGTWSESLHAGELDKSELDAPARAELFEIFPHLASFTRDFGPLARPGLSVREGQSFAA